MKTLSIVVPCYNEEKALPLLYEAMDAETEALASRFGVTLSFLLIDDGSTDGTLNIMKALKVRDERVHYLSFSRNFGKEAALQAGLEHASGDLVAVIDADLQDPPALLPQMVAGVLEEGYDCVGTRRVSRKGEPPIRSWFAHLFYRIISRISDVQLVDGARDFRVMTRQMVDAILTLREGNRFSKGLFVWVGFRTKWLGYENIERVAGENKWSFWALLRYAVDGILAFSTLPLTLALALGGLFCLVSVALLVAWLAGVGGGIAAYGCIAFFIGGVQLLCMGILGQYLARIYRETKGRPSYIVREQA